MREEKREEESREEIERWIFRSTIIPFSFGTSSFPALQLHSFTSAVSGS